MGSTSIPNDKTHVGALWPTPFCFCFFVRNHYCRVVSASKTVIVCVSHHACAHDNKLDLYRSSIHRERETSSILLVLEI